jgi:diacylglycerol kinase (ATP)
VVNGLAGSSVIFGMIPSGSGNDFPKAVGIPLDIRLSIELLVRNSTRQIDLGMLGDQYFINGLGIGLDGAVAARFSKMKKLRGEIGYIWGAIIEAIRFRGFQIEISTENWKFRGPALLAGASNGQCHGGNFKLVPHARADDGLLDIYLFEDMSLIKRIVSLPRVLIGKHTNMPGVHFKQVSKAEITLDREIPAHLDGEPLLLGPGTHTISLYPKALKLLSPSYQND